MSHLFSLADRLILAGFLVTTLVIGIQAGRRITGFRTYAVGNKDFSTPVLAATILATWVGGGFLLYAFEKMYTSGLRFVVAISGGALCLLLVGHVLAVRMEKFLNNLSVVEAMGHLYGPVARVITAVSSTWVGIGYLAIQFQVMSKMLALIIWNGLEDTGEVVRVVTEEPIFGLKTIFSWDGESFYYWSLMLYYLMPGIDPTIFQRIIMASDTKQAKEAFTHAAILTFLMILTVTWVTILLLATSSNLVPNKLVDH